MIKSIAALALAALLPLAAHAENFTTSAETKPILAATKNAWVAVREFDGKDLLYFTQIESWRCGISEVTYAINGGTPKVWTMDPCFKDSPQPNAISAERLPYTEFLFGFINTVDVTLTFDDGTTDSGSFERKAVMIP